MRRATPHIGHFRWPPRRDAEPASSDRRLCRIRTYLFGKGRAMKTQFAIRCFSVCVSAIVGTTAIAQTCQNNAACNDNDPCTFDRCDGGACSNTLAVYGDIVGRPGLDLECEPDGSVDLLDIIAVWEGFKGELEATIPGCSMFISSGQPPGSSPLACR